MTICDRCNRSDVKTTKKQWWTPEGGDKGLTCDLCRSCLNHLLIIRHKLLMANLNMSHNPELGRWPDVPKTYTLPPKRNRAMLWFGRFVVIACGIINLIIYLVLLYEKHHH